MVDEVLPPLRVAVSVDPADRPPLPEWDGVGPAFDKFTFKVQKRKKRLKGHSVFLWELSRKQKGNICPPAFYSWVDGGPIGNGASN